MEVIFMIDYNKSFATNLKKLMEENDCNANELVNKLKQLGLVVSNPSIYKWLSGNILPRPDKINALCKIFNVSEMELRGDNNAILRNAHEITKKSFKLLGNVACGEPIYADEKKSTYIMADSDIDADFCLVCKGDSMIDCGINDGDLVFIKRQPQVNNGEIAVVLIEDEATLKRVYFDDKSKTLTLIPQNKKYPPMVYKEEDSQNIQILGKAVFYQSLVK